MAPFLTETDLQIMGLRMLDGVMNDLLYHPEDMDLFFFWNGDLLHDIQLDIDGLLVLHLEQEFPDSLQQTPSLNGTRQKIMTDPSHTPDDLIEIPPRFFDYFPVSGIFDIYTANIQLHRRQKRSQSVIKIARYPFSFVLPNLLF